MKRMPFPVGSLVVNSGRLRGQGYIWRVEGYRPRWAGDRWDESKQNVLCKNLGPLHGKPERGDYHHHALADAEAQAVHLLRMLDSDCTQFAYRAFFEGAE